MERSNDMMIQIEAIKRNNTLTITISPHNKQ